MCLHFDGATPTEWKEQGRAPMFLKTSQVHSFFFFVSISNQNLQLKLSFPHLYKMAMIQTKTDWKTPQLTHCKGDSETWSFCSTKRKSSLEIRRSQCSIYTWWGRNMCDQQTQKLKCHPKSLQQRTHWSQSWSFQKRIGDIWEIVTKGHKVQF